MASYLVKKSIHKLAIIAGAGELPFQVIKYCQKTGISFIVVGLKDFFHLKQPVDFSYFFAGFGDVGKVIRRLRNESVSHIIFVGKISRPNISIRSLLSYMPDKLSLRLLRNTLYLQGGDDSLLRRVQIFFEKEGFHIIGVHELIPSLVESNIAINDLTSDEASDIEVGRQVLDSIAMFDVGQAVVVKNKHIIAIESFSGTDSLLRHVCTYPNINGAVLVKQTKIQQNLSIDMPTIGPKTVELLIMAGMRGMALESQRVILLEPDKIQFLAQKNHLFITFFNPHHHA